MVKDCWEDCEADGMLEAQLGSESQDDLRGKLVEDESSRAAKGQQDVCHTRQDGWLPRARLPAGYLCWIFQAGAGIRGRQKRVWKTRWSRESCEGPEGREEGMMGEWTS